MNERKLLRIFPLASRATVEANADLQSAEHEYNHAPTLGCAAKGEEIRMGSTAGRIILSYHFYRVRPQDPDNAAASTKNITDGLRRCGLIHGDEPWKICLEVEQTKVGSFQEERTELQIIYP